MTFPGLPPLYRQRHAPQRVVVALLAWLAPLCLAWLALPVTALSAAPLPADIIAVPGRYVWVDGRRFHLHCRGRGAPTVVLDAGLGGTSLEWSRVQPRLSELTRVCSYDRAGYGWSNAGPQPRTSEAIVQDLHRLLGYASEPSPYLLVGHSFGGLSMRLYAQRYPQRIAGLVLVDSTHERQFNDPGAPNEHKSLVPRQNRLFIIGNHGQVPQALPADLQYTARALAQLPDAVRTLYSELRYLKTSADQVYAIADQLPDVPLTVIAHDSRANAKTERARRFAERWLGLQRELAARSSQGRLIIAERSGHHIHLERPELVIEAIATLVETYRARHPLPASMTTATAENRRCDADC